MVSDSFEIKPIMIGCFYLSESSVIWQKVSQGLIAQFPE